MTSIRGIEYISTLIQRGENVLQKIEEMGRSPNKSKELKRRWNLKETAELTGRSGSSILKCQNALIENGLLDPLDKHESTNRNNGYTLRQINQLRKHFGTLPWRDDGTDECLVLAVQSFKGGVGKSVTSLCLAQYLATQGYRVLFIDMDSQASSTSSFGAIPDKDITPEETLLPYFNGAANTIDYSIVTTYWEGLDLIPSNLSLYEFELKVSNDIQNMSKLEKKLMFDDLRRGINGVKKNYDVVIIDSPPALGVTSLNILCAADALIVPTPPALYEFSSTVQYFRMIANVLEGICPEKQYKFIKILATDVYPNQTNHKEFLPLLEDVFGKYMLKSRFFHTSEIGNAAIDFQTALEVRRPQKRALDIINKVCDEIEMEIWKTWPSKNKKFQKKGIINLTEETIYV